MRDKISQDGGPKADVGEHAEELAARAAAGSTVRRIRTYEKEKKRERLDADVHDTDSPAVEAVVATQRLHLAVLVCSSLVLRVSTSSTTRCSTVCSTSDAMRNEMVSFWVLTQYSGRWSPRNQVYSSRRCRQRNLRRRHAHQSPLVRDPDRLRRPSQTS